MIRGNEKEDAMSVQSISSSNVRTTDDASGHFRLTPGLLTELLHRSVRINPGKGKEMS